MDGELLFSFQFPDVVINFNDLVFWKFSLYYCGFEPGTIPIQVKDLNHYYNWVLVCGVCERERRMDRLIDG